MIIATTEGSHTLGQAISQNPGLTGESSPGIVERVGQAAGDLQANATSSGWTDAVQTGSLSSYFEIMAILFLGLGILWFILWLIKRFSRGSFLARNQDLSIESRLNLGDKKWIIVARIHGQRLALGLTDENISKLIELPSVEEYEASLPLDDRPLALDKLKKGSRNIFNKGKSFADIAQKELAKGKKEDVNSDEDLRLK